MALQKSLRVLEKSNPPNPHSVILQNRRKTSRLLFESGVVAILCTQEYDQVKKYYTKVVDAYCCLGVLQMNTGDTYNQYLIVVTGCVSVGKIGDTEIFKITQTQFISLQYEQQQEEKIGEVRKFLNSGTFYFGYGTNNDTPLGSIDITLCAQRKLKTNFSDQRFFWNRMLHVLLLRFGINTEEWLVKAMCGSIEIRTIYVGHRQARAALFSRLSCERAGTRFNVRGTNDEGHVANFVETEQVIYFDDAISSFVQTRGSIPLFWEQTGVQVGAHKIKLSRGYEASKAAFDKHMRMLRDRYGFIAIINLLSTTAGANKDGEAFLSAEFQRHHQESEHTEVPHIIFDYHAECRGGNTTNLQNLKLEIKEHSQLNTFFTSFNNVIQSEQIGVIRTNCLDCLDRTNSVQTYIGILILEQQLKLLLMLTTTDKIPAMIERFIEVFRQMWVVNGNEVSKIYAGTGAIQGGSRLIDGARSAARTIQNNLLDNAKQEAIDVLLFGSTLNSELADRSRILLPSYMLHAPSNVLREMCRRYNEYTRKHKLRVGVGTYNVNGGKQFKSVAFKGMTMADWLLHINFVTDDFNENGEPETVAQPIEPSCDIYAVGFEEIVDLSAGNIVSASSENARQWCDEIEKTLLQAGKYVLISYQQLVGVCLFVYVKSEYVEFIRDVAVDSVKTGLGGATGNKGAVAIRFVLHGTSMCFVCAHFAAGQSQVTERNADFAEITRKLVFPMNRSLNSHEYIFFCGDFNYRIDIDRNQLKEMIQNKEYQEILKQDQLHVQQEQGNVFKNYIEGPVNFAPTYKYDLFSDDYDTSEKARSPAWTDRVLWRRRRQIPDTEFDHADWSPGICSYYGRTELKQSDHRPVFAIIDVDICSIDEQLRLSVYYEVLKYLGPPDGTVCIKCPDSDDSQIQIFEPSFVNDIVTELSNIGHVIMVRFDGDTMWATFRDPQCSLVAAGSRSTLVVSGRTLHITLRTPNWVQDAEREIALCMNNTIPLSVSSNAKKVTPVSPGRLPPRPPKPIGTMQMEPTRPAPAVPNANNSQQMNFKDQTHYNLEPESSIDEIPEPLGPPPELPPAGWTQPPRPVMPVTNATPPPIPARTNKPPPLPARPLPK